MKNGGPKSEKISLNHTNMRQGFQEDSGYREEKIDWKVDGKITCLQNHFIDIESCSASIQKSQAKVKNIVMHYIR